MRSGEGARVAPRAPLRRPAAWQGVLARREQLEDRSAARDRASDSDTAVFGQREDLLPGVSLAGT
jgi:hypothetical protein